MTSSLKQKTVSGLTWSFVENMARQLIIFVIGVILARLLLPAEYGLFGIVSIFVGISRSFVNSGFNQALIQKQRLTDEDCSTVFFFNLAVAILFYGLLALLARPIADFFKQPTVAPLLIVVSLVLIIDALTLVQDALLIKKIDFKRLSVLSIVSNVLSGAIGIGFAYKGFGVWSFVAKQLSERIVYAILLWYSSAWRPLLTFSRQSFKELFAFGSRLLVSGLLDTLWRNIYLFVIGKYFSPADLGYFSRADQFRNIPSQNLNEVVQRVSFPVLATIQDDVPRLRAHYTRLIRVTMLIAFMVMLGMAAVARPMVLVLIGEKWEPSVLYLQLLCISGMLYPLHALNLTILKVRKRTDLYLRLEIIKKILVAPVIAVGLLYGITAMIVAMIVNAFAAYYLNSYYSGMLIDYPWRKQVKDILPSLLIASAVSGLVYLLGTRLDLAPIWTLLIQTATGAALFFAYCELTRFGDYIFLKHLVIEVIHKKIPLARRRPI